MNSNFGDTFDKVKDTLKDISDKFSVFDLSLKDDNARV